LFCLINYFKN